MIKFIFSEIFQTWFLKVSTKSFFGSAYVLINPLLPDNKGNALHLYSARLLLTGTSTIMTEVSVVFLS